MIRALVQAGHVAPREPGFETGTGAAGEQELVLAIRGALAAKLRADGRFDVTLAPGNLPDGWSGDYAYFLHADANANRAARGYSFGYQTPEAHRLSELVANAFDAAGHPGGHRADNYTPDEHYYYGFGHTGARVELLVEHGFLTNRAEREWMTANVGRLAEAEYQATVRHAGLSPRHRPIGERPPWGDLLQLWIRPAGGPQHRYVGWEEAFPAVKWVARNGLRAGTSAALAWGEGDKRRVERDNRIIVLTCRALVALSERGFPT